MSRTLITKTPHPSSSRSAGIADEIADDDDENQFGDAESYRQILGSSVLNYEDCFTFEAVDANEVKALTFVNAKKAVVQQFTRKVASVVAKDKMKMSPLDFDPLVAALSDLIRFALDTDGRENDDALLIEALGVPEHQTILFEQEIVSHCLDFLRAPFRKQKDFKKKPGYVIIFM